ncbi:MAG TPA: methyl-accepting chemotaxis protein, partial [Myxococcaceae bacterium]|nr:methyl-accepting chemotaxis protein [Myxococcaceae bacterium]
MSLDPKNEIVPAEAPRGAKKVPAPLKPIADTVLAVLAGNLGARVPNDALDDSVAGLGQLLNQLLERHAAAEHRKQVAAHEIDQAIDSLLALVREGDLAQWNTSTEDPQLAPLLEGFGKVIETLRTFVREMNEAALRLSSSANQVLAASTQHETSSTEQAAAIHETTATMEELKHASAQIAENAGSVARVAEETLGAARAGRGAIGEFIQAMQQIRSDGVAVADSITQLSTRVERIGTVVEVIDEIADRSD